ncbi:MAG: DnaJ domain-containing protein [Hyphomicrobiales bacterium]|nr:DnaJ domain-containing protein [Hyphomicrobiales bacterium]
MRDPYDILGLGRQATVGEIKKAYRRLAKANHPDQNKDPKARDRFNEATQAYDLLSDAKKRAAFDRGEIDAEGKPKFQGFDGFGAGGPQTRRHPGASGAASFDFGGGRGFDASDIFADLFGGGGRTARGAQSQRGQDIEASLEVSLEDIARGNPVRVTLPSGRTLDIRIPRGAEDGKAIRLKGQGEPGPVSGDLLLTLHFAKNARFTREGRDLRLDVPVTLYEAVLGAEIEVTTLDGAVKLKVPPGAHHGRAMRLKGKGLPGPGTETGDLYVTLRITLPPEPGHDLETLMQQWRETRPYQLRR